MVLLLVVIIIEMVVAFVVAAAAMYQINTGMSFTNLKLSTRNRNAKKMHIIFY